MTANLHIVLHEPEIPQNTGNIGRTCVALKAHLWLIRPLGFEIDQKQVRRAGLDYWKDLHLTVVDDWDELVERLPSNRCWYFTKRAPRIYTDADFQSADVLVFGGERFGLPDTLLSTAADRCLRIPISDEVRSLNLSNAVAVAAYELARQCELRL